MSVQRLNSLRKKLDRENLDGMIVTHLDHIRYLVGFTGTAGLLIVNKRGADFFTDVRYTFQAGKQVKGARVHTAKAGLIAALSDFPGLNVKNRKYGFVSEYLTVQHHGMLREKLPNAVLIEADEVVRELGWVKEKQEIEWIEKAVAISDTAFERVLQLVRPGVREKDLAAELEYQMTMLGSEKPAFETILASGYRSAMPHGMASRKKIAKGDFVTFDFGATVCGYVSDMTRTVVIGKATARQRKIYGIVKRAQAAAIRKMKPGASSKAVDAAARRTIEKAGFGKNFGHGTGHGIGYFIHVGPRLSPLTDDKLMINNVITVEPGIYIEGWGGVRIEDDVVVTRTGPRVLNRAEKKLLEL
ncbi:MAG: aminopeptidase P family protein [Candidatus Zixiibacteriota bacterium]|nr:MAG: aminopeptidase P family protein [candidate division Zixibacteria bacterium]